MTDPKDRFPPEMDWQNPDPPSPIQPNRPDALGISPASRASEVRIGPPIQQGATRYDVALRRLVARLEARGQPASEAFVRGKRKGEFKGNSHTIKLYLRAMEIWAAYSIAVFGKELEPQQVRTDHCYTFAKWMMGGNDPNNRMRINPDIQAFRARSQGRETWELYQACRKACEGRPPAQATIYDIAQNLPSDLYDAWIGETDLSNPAAMGELHTKLSDLIRDTKTIDRDPKVKTLRRKLGRMWTNVEQDPRTYRYSLSFQPALKISSISTYLRSLSALWTELGKVENSQIGDVAPLIFNPWKEVAKEYAFRANAIKEQRKQAGDTTTVTTPLVQACFLAAAGINLESRRDTFALAMLTYCGLRAEELAGLLRKDILDQDGQFRMWVVGKGNKGRTVPMYTRARDAFAAMDATLEEYTAKRRKNQLGQVEPSYAARYAASLLTPEAPLCPSLIRWGTNSRDAFPEQAAMESLDVSGVRAITSKLARRARVKVVATDEIRPLLPEELEKIHPHSFRHYFATAAQKNGVPIRDVQEILGHTTVSTTMTYIEVSTIKTQAAGAAVDRALSGGGPMTPEEVARFAIKRRSPIDQPEIQPVRPELDPAWQARKTPAQVQEKERVMIVNPLWAYSQPEQTLAYLPTPTATAFSAGNSELISRLQNKQQMAAAAGDVAETERLEATIRATQARYAYLTLRVGRLSRLPWWTGRANRWSGDNLAPIPSPFQLAPDTEHDREFTESLDDLYGFTLQTDGPSAAASMVIWIEEIVNFAGVALWKDVEERGDKWVAFSEPAMPDSGIIREHEPSIFIAWLEEKGKMAFVPSNTKSASLGKNPVLRSMESLPEWFWLNDPIDVLPEEEKAFIQGWINTMSGRRSDQRRVERVVSRIASLLSAYSIKAESFSEKYPDQGARASTAASLDAQTLNYMRNAVNEELARSFPEVSAPVTATAVLRATDAGRPMQERLRGFLKSAGAAIEGGGRGPRWDVLASFDPRDRARAFSPEYLTFENGTIKHSDEARKKWFESYGTDSECVVRRALRAVWERKKQILEGKDRGASTKIWEQWLSFVVPCPAQMEERMIQAGWQPPATPTERIQQLQQVWSGFIAWIIQRQGIQPRIPALPDEVVELVIGPSAQGIETMVRSATFTQTPSRTETEQAVLTSGLARPGAPYENPQWQKSATKQAPNWIPTPKLWDMRPDAPRWPGYPLPDMWFDGGLGPAAKKLVNKETGQLWQPQSPEEEKIWVSEMRKYARWRRRFTREDPRFQGPHMMAEAPSEPASLQIHGWQDPNPDAPQWQGYPWPSLREIESMGAFYVQLPPAPGQPLSPRFNEAMRSYARWKRWQMGYNRQARPNAASDQWGAPTILQWAIMNAWPLPPRAA